MKKEKITDNLIMTVKDRLDVLALFEDYVLLKKTGKSWIGLCPFHSEKTPSFTVSPDKGMFHCFGCNEGGDVISFVRKVEKLSFVEAIDRLARRVGIDISDSERGDFDRLDLEMMERELGKSEWWTDKKEKPEEESDDKPELSTEEWEARAAPLVGSVPKYIIERGITIDTAREWQLGRTTDPATQTFKGDSRRVVFTIRNRKGELVGLCGRRIGDEGPKYYFWPGFKRNRYLYGEDKVDPSKKHLIDVEGFIDVLMLQQHGFNCVGNCGTAISKIQMQKLIDLVPPGGRLYSMTDGDAAGRKSNNSLVWRAKNRVPLYFINLGNGVDPKMLSERDIKKAMELAVLA